MTVPSGILLNEAREDGKYSRAHHATPRYRVARVAFGPLTIERQPPLGEGNAATACVVLGVRPFENTTFFAIATKRCFSVR